MTIRATKADVGEPHAANLPDRSQDYGKGALQAAIHQAMINGVGEPCPALRPLFGERPMATAIAPPRLSSSKAERSLLIVP